MNDENQNPTTPLTQPPTVPLSEPIIREGGDKSFHLNPMPETPPPPPASDAVE